MRFGVTVCSSIVYFSAKIVAFVPEVDKVGYEIDFGITGKRIRLKLWNEISEILVVKLREKMRISLAGVLDTLHYASDKCI